MYVEVRRLSDDLILIWANTEGERGTDEPKPDDPWSV